MVKVILIKSVAKVGKSGDVVQVSDGYAANSLFPNKLAILATKKNLENLDRKKQSNAELKAFEHELLEKAIESLPNMVLEIKVKANEKGHLFSKIDAQNIVEALSKHRIIISKNNILLNNPIKNIGSYEVSIQEGAFKTKINVSIVTEK